MDAKRHSSNSNIAILGLLSGLLLTFGWLIAGTASADSTQPEAVHDHAAHSHRGLQNLAGGPPGETVETHHEIIPNPVHGSDFAVSAQCQAAAQACDWDNPSTWQTGSVPGPNTRVIVDGKVEIRTEQAIARSIGVYPGGTLSFAQNTNTRLATADLLVFEGGTLHVGTPDAPINGNVQAEIIFRDISFDANDPTQILRGLVAPGGTVRVSGSPLGDNYLRTSVEPVAGSTTITTSTSLTAAGWRVGDSVVIPTSRQCVTAAGETCESETEDRIVTAISDNTATLNAPLSFDHPGARDIDGQVDFLPYVINTTRNVIFRSENPQGLRAHMLFHGRVDVDIRYAEIVDLGRTTIADLGANNQKGRYPLHAHHLIGPVSPQANGHQFTLIGNNIDFGEENVSRDHKWGISIHGSHYGLIERNVVDHASGAAIVTESGSEAGNVLRENFAVRVVGGNGERLEDIDPFDGTKSGRAGVGFWFNGGGRNSFQNNIAADVVECIYCFGFKFDNVFPESTEVSFPSSQGDDPFIDGGETIAASFVGINDFVGNEAYAVPNGMTVWWVCTTFETPRDNCSSQLESFNVWHHHRWGFYGYETNNMTLDGFVVRGDADALRNGFELVRGLEFSDYLQRNLLISSADIQNQRTGMRLPAFRDVRGATGPDDGFFELEDSYIVATEGLGLFAPHSVNGVATDLAAQTTVLRNVRFDYPRVVQPGVERGHLVVSNRSILNDDSKSNFEVRNDVVVENYNVAPGVDGDDFTIVPGYQDPSRCQASVSNCDVDLTARYDDIVNGHIFPVAGSTGPTQPAPVQPEPTQPPPTQPAPVQPEPTQPPTTQPAPVQPEPTQPDAPFFAPGAPNLLTNGTFSSESVPWYSWSLDNSHNFALDNGEVRLTHVNSTGINFSQFFQEIGRVTPGDTYRLRFDVRSNRNDGQVGIRFQQSVEPWQHLSGPQEVNVGTTTETVEVILTPNSTSAGTTLMFELQGDAQTIWIDNVELVEASDPGGEAPPITVPAPTAGPNLLTNGAFTTGLDPWRGWALDHDLELSVNNGEIQMSHINTSGVNFSQLSQGIGRVTPDDTYRLRFDVRSNRSNGQVGIRFQQSGAPHGQVTTPEEIQVGTTTQSIEVILTPNIISAETRFMFQLQDDAQTIWIDNVELVEIQ